jgi:hypothetical protein
MHHLPGFMTALALVILLAKAPSAKAADDAQVWTSLSTTVRIHGDLSGFADVNTRLVDNGSQLGHLQLRGGLGWRLRPGVSVGIGYSYIRTESLSNLVAHEHRLFQQASYPLLSWRGTTLTGRTRLEQRRFNGMDETFHRLRQQLRLNIPLEGPAGLRAIVHSEAFIVLNQPSGAPSTGLNQLRSFAGLGIPVANGVALEAGYLNQSIFFGEDRQNHALSLGVVTSF